jgi:hypothetical protein
MDRLVELDEGFLPPQLSPDFVVRDQRAGPARQQEEELEGLRLEAMPPAVPEKFPRRRIQLEPAEPESLVYINGHPRNHHVPMNLLTQQPLSTRRGTIRLP